MKNLSPAVPILSTLFHCHRSPVYAEMVMHMQTNTHIISPFPLRTKAVKHAVDTVFLLALLLHDSNFFNANI